MHSFALFVGGAIVGFGAGAVYGHTLASLAQSAAKMAHENATQELKKFRGELGNLRSELANLVWRKEGQ
jgi:hypothetical protein